MKSLAFSLLRTVLDDPGATSQSDLPRSLPIQSDPLERLHKVARVFTSGDTQLALGATSRSDPARSLPKLGATCPERQGEVARHLGSRRQEIALGATSRSDPARSLPKPGATCRSDEPRSLRVSISLELMISQGPFGHFIMHEDPLAVNEVEGLEGQEELCFINNNGSWYKKEPNFQYNNYQQKSYPNNQQSGYPPRNNQQGSYQPQQNPSSGSSAPQESSTDTLLKQILESQTRSEKQVGYELKNLHSKIDGSYNELNNKFSHLASTLKRGEKVTIGRTEHRSDLSQRPSEVAPEAWSDLSRATGRSRSPSWFPETRNRSRSDLSQRPSEVAPEAWSDLSERRAEVAARLNFTRTYDFSRAFWSFHYARFTFQKPILSEYLHSQCFDIPQNWFDNHLYYNICLRSLENS
ncbi:hypothetical protein IGI04_022464 [Brassica rapa subsp. trilocularis]|uniref:Uncharacterized protein n=1 Tax=Brassica rapa subsp. trilocularis TaxID=1813537 RepID=A0ABQ7M3I9_BRACM|nr:hypothetical protein IGI04_022464 [Brassica rapa subsp. trilocularis]